MSDDRTCWARFKPLDLVGFSSYSRLGAGINLFSLGVPFYHLSHVGVIARHPEHPWPMICESTAQYRKPCVVTGKVLDGVQWHKIKERIRGYYGMVYHYPLRIPLTPEQEGKLSTFLMEMTGRHYDALGALGARDTLLGMLARLGMKEDLISLFCSELCAAAGGVTGTFPQKLNASGYSPNRLARKAVWWWKTHWRPWWVKRCPCAV